jgi:serine/threonine protein kinase
MIRFEQPYQRSVAIKTLPNNIDGQLETKILYAAQGHPNIIKLLDVKEASDNIVMTMEAYPRTLLDVVSEHPEGIPMPRVARIFSQIVNGLQHLHKLGFIHGDVKLENIVIDEAADDHIYLIDFGMSSPYTPGSSLLRIKGGSPHYAAPEVWQCRPCEGPEVDVWALGVCLFLMVTSYFPFSGDNPEEVWKQIETCQLWKDDTLKSQPVLFDLLTQMNRWHLRWRIKLAEIEAHPWMRAQRQTESQHVSSPPAHQDSCSTRKRRLRTITTGVKEKCLT